MGVIEFKLEEEFSCKYDDLFVISMCSVDWIWESEFILILFSFFFEIVIMVLVVEVGDGELIVCIGVILWM